MSASKLTASIIAIGSEMLGPTRVDTNSLKVTAALEDFAVALVRKSVVGDVLRDLVDEIRYSLERADILILSGGLGPTAYASSASRTCSADRSHSEYTATGDTPISRHARITRTAISPRLAMRTFFMNTSSG